MINLTLLIICLSVLCSTSALGAQRSICEILFCKKPSKQPTVLENENDDFGSSPQEEHIKAVLAADKIYLKKRRWRCTEEGCACSYCIIGCLASLGCAAPLVCHDTATWCKEIDKKRGQDEKKLKAVLMPSTEQMQ